MKRAEDAIHAYQDRVCGTQPPPAADVVFTADGSSKAFCTANGPFNGGFEKVAGSGFDPDTMRAFVTADIFTQTLGGLDAAAPVAIAPDVKAVTAWFRGRWSDLLADFDYDLRRILLNGTPEDRAVFTRSHPDIAEHWSRTAAYEEQICPE